MSLGCSEQLVSSLPQVRPKPPPATSNHVWETWSGICSTGKGLFLGTAPPFPSGGFTLHFPEQPGPPYSHCHRANMGKGSEKKQRKPALTLSSRFAHPARQTLLKHLQRAEKCISCEQHRKQVPALVDPHTLGCGLRSPAAPGAGDSSVGFETATRLQAAQA